MADTRIPYGARCTWWDSIDKVGLTLPGVSGHRLPCCPICRGMLFEVDSEEVWFAGAQRHEDRGHPGYVAMITWARGRCFPNMAHLQEAYEEAQANLVTLATDSTTPTGINEVIAILETIEVEEGVSIFDHTAEEIGLAVMACHAELLAKLKGQP